MQSDIEKPHMAYPQRRLFAFDIILILSTLVFFATNHIPDCLANNLDFEKCHEKIPNNLLEVHVALDKILSVERKNQIKEYDPESLITQEHFGLGLFIRNCWIHLDESPLYDYFVKLKVIVPDNISSIILRSYWCHLNKKAFELELEIQKVIQEESFAFEVSTFRCPDKSNDTMPKRLKLNYLERTAKAYCDETVWEFSPNSGWGIVEEEKEEVYDENSTSVTH